MRLRSYRRHKWAAKFARRVQRYSYWSWLGTSSAEFKEEVKKGRCSWLRTTGRPCNCYSCTYRSYKRPSKSEVKKLIYKELSH